jgi:hypothetical protein
MYHEYPPAERQDHSPGPRSSRGRYLKNRSGLWFLTKPDDPADLGEWVSDPIKPLARVFIEKPHLRPLGEWALEIEFSGAEGGTRRSLIRYDRVHTRGHEVIAILAGAGLRVAADHKGHDRFLNYLARVRPPTALRLGELTVQGIESVLCLRAFTLAPDGGVYEPHSFELCDLYDGGRKLPQVVRILDHEEDVI